MNWCRKKAHTGNRKVAGCGRKNGSAPQRIAVPSATAEKYSNVHLYDKLGAFGRVLAQAVSEGECTAGICTTARAAVGAGVAAAACAFLLQGSTPACLALCALRGGKFRLSPRGPNGAFLLPPVLAQLLEVAARLASADLAPAELAWRAL